MIPWTQMDQALSESPRLLGVYVCLSFATGLMIGFTPGMLIGIAVAVIAWFVFPFIGRLALRVSPTGASNA